MASARKLPATRTTAAPVQPRAPQAQPNAIAAAVDVPSPPRSEVAPLAPERYKVQFTIGRETYEKLRRVQDLLRHRLPSGDPAAIFDRAITLLLEDLEKKKIAATKRPGRPVTDDKRSRHIPADTRRTVWARDGGRCKFAGPHGRCSETGFLEFHHVVPYAAGGATTADNLELRCAAHNRYEAEQHFDREFPMFVREERGVGIWSECSAAEGETRIVLLPRLDGTGRLFKRFVAAGHRVRRQCHQELGPTTTGFYRMFMIPGMFHCGAGVGVNAFDVLTPLVQWVERGAAPQSILGSRVVDGTTAPTRPLCPYPELAKNKRTGGIDEAANVTCSKP